MTTEIILSQCEFQSTTREPRTVWIQRPPTTPPSGICMFLDAEYYLAQVRVAPIIAGMQQSGKLPQMLTAYVSSFTDSPVRWTDSFCNEGFADYLATELLPWLIAEFNVTPSENILAGLSLTGLSAAHAALKHPAAFPRVLSQSGSFWWNKTWLPEEVRHMESLPLAFRLTVGVEEVKGDTTHTNHGRKLVQLQSQRESNRRMRDALVAMKHHVSYFEHPGGHDFPQWRDGLEESLTTLLALPLG